MSDPDVAKRSRRAFGVVSHPLRTITLYCVLYHLAKLEDVTEATYDWKRHRDTLYHGLFDYGVYAVGRELSHLQQSFHVGGRVYREAVPPGRGEVWIDEAVEQVVPARHHGRFRRWMGTPALRDDREDVTSADEFERYCWLLRDAGDAFADTDAFLDFADVMFQTGYAEDFETGAVPDDAVGWDAAFGGWMWNRTVEHLQNHDELPPTAWVDTTMGLQHNTGSFLDKAAPAESERDLAIDVTGEVYQGKHPHTGEELYYENDLDRILEHCLDAGAKGNIRYLGAFARRYQSDLGFPLRRYVDSLPGSPPEDYTDERKGRLDDPFSRGGGGP